MRQALEQSDDVVTRHPDQAAREWQAINLGTGSGRLRERLAQCVEVGLTSRRPRLFLAADYQAIRIHAHLERCAESQERVARQPLATLHAFEQKARLQGRELQKRRYGCVQVGCNIKWCLH